MRPGRLSGRILSPGVLRDELGERPPECPAVQFQRGAVWKIGHRAEAQDRHRLGVGRHRQQGRQLRSDRRATPSPSRGPRIGLRARGSGWRTRPMPDPSGAGCDGRTRSCLCRRTVRPPAVRRNRGCLRPSARGIPARVRPAACAVCTRSSSTSACMRRRSSSSVMRMNRHGCIRPTLGAACAAWSKRARTSSGTVLPGTNRRMSRRSAITR